MTYSDKYGTFFGRVREDGNVVILHVEEGEAATRLNAAVYPILANGRSSELSARYEHPEGIVLTRADTDRLGIEIE